MKDLRVLMSYVLCLKSHIFIHPYERAKIKKTVISNECEKSAKCFLKY